MWILLVTILFYGQPGSGHSNAQFGSVDFQSEATCNAGRQAYLAEVKPIADRMNNYIADETQVGNVRGPTGVFVSAVCVQK
jgi:hypothetical protein